MSRAVRVERGSALVIALLVVTVMMALGLGTFAFVEGEQRASADERVRDASYSLAEAALESAVAYLNTQWPNSGSGSLNQPYGHKTTDASGVGGNCGPSSASGDACPDPSSVTSSFTQSDYTAGQGSTWVTTVRDNVTAAGSTCATTLNLTTSDGTTPSCFYRESTTGASSVPEYDKNGDGAVWVRAQATVQGRTRVLVALVRAQPQPLPYQRVGIWGYDLALGSTLAGKVVDLKGTAGLAAPAEMYCNQGGYHSLAGICPAYVLGKNVVQPGSSATLNYTLGNPCINEAGTTLPNFPTTSCLGTNQGADIIALRKKAQALGTYYTSCPTTAAQYTGPDVFIEVSTVCNTPAATSNYSWNSAASPGLLVLTKGLIGTSPCASCGSLNINGTNNTYYGLIYDAAENSSGWNCDLKIMGTLLAGTSKIQGAYIGDQGTCLAISSTAVPAFTYDPRAWGTLTIPGPIKIIPGTFREVPPSS